MGTAQDLSIGKYQVLSQRRFSRTEFEYSIRAELENRSGNHISATALLDASRIAKAVVVDGSLTFGIVAPSSSVISVDTFTIRLDRTISLNTDSLKWIITPTVVDTSVRVAISSPTDGSVTEAAMVAVTGTVTAAATVRVNGIDAVVNNGNFAVEVPLVEGLNTLTAIARNTFGNQASASVSVRRLGPPPTIRITSPADQFRTVAEMVAVNGTLSPAGSTVKVNGADAVVVGTEFSAVVPLVEGANTITAVVTDGFARSASAVIQVVRDPVVEELAIQITSPADGAIVDNLTVNVSGTVTVGATVKVNGIDAAVSGGQFSATIPLAVGENTITAVARNAGGTLRSATITVTRIDRPPSEPPTISIDSPMEGLKTRESELEVAGSVENANTVAVNGVAATIQDHRFTARIPLREGRNPITALAIGDGGSASVALNVTRDTTPPILNIEGPWEGAKLDARQVTVVGMVNDVVPGTVNPEQVRVLVNGVEATVRNRSYELQDLLLSPGLNKILVTARDRAGNEANREVQVTVLDEIRQKRIRLLAGNNQVDAIGRILPVPLVVELIGENGAIETNQPVIFEVVRNDGLVVSGSEEKRSITLKTGEDGQTQVLFRLGTRTGAGNNQVRVTSPGAANEIIFCAGANNTQPARVAALAPETQVGGVDTRLPLPWTVYVVDAGGNPVSNVPLRFAVTVGTGTIDGLPAVERVTDSDGRASALLTLGAEPGLNNNVVVASLADVTDGPAATFLATALQPADVANTRVVGVVLDHANQPL